MTLKVLTYTCGVSSFMFKIMDQETKQNNKSDTMEGSTYNIFNIVLNPRSKQAKILISHTPVFYAVVQPLPTKKKDCSFFKKSAHLAKACCLCSLKFVTYHKVASSNTSRLEAHAGIFRLLMKGIFDPYVL